MGTIIFIAILIGIYYVADRLGYGSVGLIVDGFLLFSHWWLLAIIAIVIGAYELHENTAQ